jgi:hypothetical protein
MRMPEQAEKSVRESDSWKRAYGWHAAKLRLTGVLFPLGFLSWFGQDLLIPAVRPTGGLQVTRQRSGTAVAEDGESGDHCPNQFPMNSRAGAFGQTPPPGSASGCSRNGVAYGRERITARDRQEYVESRYMPTRSGRRPRKRAASPTGSGEPVTNDEVASSRDHVVQAGTRAPKLGRPGPAPATISVTGQDIAQKVTWLKTSSRAVGEPGTGA